MTPFRESGYESDTNLKIRRKQNISPLSPEEQKQAYKKILRGGEVPLTGLRKPAPERPKDDLQTEYFRISPTLTRIRVHQRRIAFSPPVTFPQYKRSLSSLSTSKRFQSPRSASAETDASFATDKARPKSAGSTSALDARSSAKPVARTVPRNSEVSYDYPATPNSVRSNRGKLSTVENTSLHRKRVCTDTAKLAKMQQVVRSCFHDLIPPRRKPAAVILAKEKSHACHPSHANGKGTPEKRQARVNHAVTVSKSKDCKDRTNRVDKLQHLVKMKTNEDSGLACRLSVRKVSQSSEKAKECRNANRSLKCLSKKLNGIETNAGGTLAFENRKALCKRFETISVNALSTEASRIKQWRGKLQDIVKRPESIYIKPCCKKQKYKHVCVLKSKKSANDHEDDAEKKKTPRKPFEIYIRRPHEANQAQHKLPKSCQSLEPIRNGGIRSFVRERIIKHQESIKESLRYKPRCKFFDVYLTYKQPVSKSRFKSSSVEGTRGKVTGADLARSGYSTNDSENARHADRVEPEGRSRKIKLVSPLSSSKPEATQISPCPHRRKVDTPNVAASRRARARSAGAADEIQRARFMYDRNEFVAKSSAAIDRGLCRPDQSSSRKRPSNKDYTTSRDVSSRKFADLFDFYTSLERLNELRREASYRDSRSVARAEELDSLCAKLKALQKEKDFLCIARDAGKCRWQGDRGLRCKQKSVENILQGFRTPKDEERKSVSCANVCVPSWRRRSLCSVRNAPDDATGAREKMQDVKGDRQRSRHLSLGSVQEKSCRRSLSVEQMAVLKHQLEAIYSNKCTDKVLSPCSWKRKKIADDEPLNENGKDGLSHYEVVVPLKDVDGFEEKPQNLRVRCHSDLPADQLESRVCLRKSDSIGTPYCTPSMSGSERNGPSGSEETVLPDSGENGAEGVGERKRSLSGEGEVFDCIEIGGSSLPMAQRSLDERLDDLQENQVSCDRNGSRYSFRAFHDEEENGLLAYGSLDRETVINITQKSALEIPSYENQDAESERVFGNTTDRKFEIDTHDDISSVSSENRSLLKFEEDERAVNNFASYTNDVNEGKIDISSWENVMRKEQSQKAFDKTTSFSTSSEDKRESKCFDHVSETGIFSCEINAIEEHSQDISDTHSINSDKSEGVRCTSDTSISVYKTGNDKRRGKHSETKFLGNIDPEYVPKRIERYEANEKRIPERPKQQEVGKLRYSQSFANLKELFGETETAKYTTFPFASLKTRSISKDGLQCKTRHAESKSRSAHQAPCEEHEKPSRSSAPKPSRRIRSISLCSSVSDTDRYLKDYLKSVNNGTVKRLRARFEKADDSDFSECCSEAANLTSKRYQSDPDLTSGALRKILACPGFSSVQDVTAKLRARSPCDNHVAGTKIRNARPLADAEPSRPDERLIDDRETGIEIGRPVETSVSIPRTPRETGYADRFELSSFTPDDDTRSSSVLSDAERRRPSRNDTVSPTECSSITLSEHGNQDDRCTISSNALKRLEGCTLTQQRW